MARIAKPKVFKHNDIIVFLNEMFLFFKNKENKSMRDFAAELNFSSGFLPLILNRKRNLNSDVLKKILKHFKFNAREMKFAENLRLIANANDAAERQGAIERIGKMKAYRDHNQSEFEIYKFLSHWYFVAIKEMTELEDFNEDPAWIQNRLRYKISQKEVEDALVFLKKNKILTYSNGKLLATNRDMNCEEGIYKISLGNFHKQVLDLAWRAIDEVPRENRRLFGHTLKVDSSQTEAINNILAEAFEKIKALHSDNANHEEVYHVELISIPLTKKVEK